MILLRLSIQRQTILVIVYCSEKKSEILLKIVKHVFIRGIDTKKNDFYCIFVPIIIWEY